MIISSFQMNESGLEANMDLNLSALAGVVNTWTPVPYIVLGNVHNSTTNTANWPITQNAQYALADLIREFAVITGWGLVDQSKYYQMARMTNGTGRAANPLIWEDNFLKTSPTRQGIGSKGGSW